MVEFLLNKEHIVTDLPTGSILLDFIRHDKHLHGTKIGCREGDCGACTVLVGSLLPDGSMDYKSVTSCLTPIGSVHKKHVVTIEGLNQDTGLSTIQDTFKKNNATQCGFCTPGFIVSLTGYSFNKKTSISGIINSVSGNICRCTGYKSIKKSSKEIAELLVDKNIGGNISRLIDAKIIPEYFKEIPHQLLEISEFKESTESKMIVGGGTDLYVTQADNICDHDVNLTYSSSNSKIEFPKDECIIGAGANANNIANNTELQKHIPNLHNYFNLISSEQIRNMGTLGGNLVNASPIADLAIFFLALNSELTINNNSKRRTVLLKEFFKDYKEIDLHEGEILESIKFKLPTDKEFFNFEKVSKRTHLDIASVNSAIKVRIKGKNIAEVYISAGGVAPTPLFLKNTCNFLKDKELTALNIRKAHCVLKEEIAPISDVRGSEEYKRLLMRQLYYSHFIKLFPNIISINDIQQSINK